MMIKYIGTETDMSCTFLPIFGILKCDLLSYLAQKPTSILVFLQNFNLVKA